MIRTQARYSFLNESMPRFMTREAFAATVCPRDMLFGEVVGLSTPGDLGFGAIYKRVTTLPTYSKGWFRSQDRFLPDGTSSPTNGGYWMYWPVNSIIDIGHLGAIGSGLDADALTNQAAIETANALSYTLTDGAVIRVPRGHFKVNSFNPSVGGACFQPRGNTSIIGCGNKGASKVTGVAGHNMNMVNMAGYDHVEISGLTIDGNGFDPAHTLATHVIRITDGGFTHLTIKDCDLLNGRTYLIALQGDDSGENSYIDINNIYAYRSGRDGFDIKDRTGTNVGIYISETTVVEPGYRHTTSSGQSTAGIDIRGICCVSDCQILGVTTPSSNDIAGIRVRQDPENPLFKGGQRSQITNCFVTDSGVTGTGRSAGIAIGNDYVNVSNVTVEGCWNTAQFFGENITCTGLQGKEFTERGIVFIGTAKKVKVANPILVSTVASSDGILASTDAEQLLISNPTIEVPTGAGIRMQTGTTGRVVGDVDITAPVLINNESASGAWRLPWDSASASTDTLAAATTLNLNSVYGSTILVTGDATINQMLLGNGFTRTLIFDDLCTILHDAAVDSPIELPGGTTTTTGTTPATVRTLVVGPGDKLTVYGRLDGSGDPYVQCIDVERAGVGIAQFASSALEALTTATAKDLASITISNPGTYEISGQICFNGGTGVSATRLIGWINTSATTVPNPVTPGAPIVQPMIDTISPVAGINHTYAIPTGVIEVGLTSKTIYLGAWATFSGGTMEADGYMSARRIR